MPEFIELVEKLRPFLPDRELKQLVLMHEFPADQLERETAKQLVFKLYLQHIQELPGLGSQILLEPPSAEVAGGEYPLGRIYHGLRPTDSIFGLREEDWIRHVAIFGMSGCLPEGTLIQTPSGLRPIEKISGTVKSFDFDKQEIVPAQAVPSYSGKKKIVKLHTDLGVLRCSADHKWFVLRGGKVAVVAARNLKRTDKLLCAK
jgi:hypothetical protein